MTVLMAFPTAEDVATRLGRDLTATETTQVDAIITSVQGLISGAADLTVEELEELNPFPDVLSALCIEKAIRILANPSGVENSSEQLGSYRYSATYTAGSGTVMLTQQERRDVRRAVNAATFYAVQLVTPYSGDTDEDDDLPLDSGS